MQHPFHHQGSIHPCALTSRGRRPGTSQGVLAPPAGPHLFTKWILVGCLCIFPAVGLWNHRHISPHQQPALQRSQLKEIFPHKGTMRVFWCCSWTRTPSKSCRLKWKEVSLWIQLWATIINISKEETRKCSAHSNEPTCGWVSAHCTAVWHTTLRFTPVALVL